LAQLSVGAVIVKDNRILSTGYNGAPVNYEHCVDRGCIREKLKIPSGTQHESCYAIHAEQNAILQAASYGTSIQGSDLYCTHSPCIICAKMIINVGIANVYYKHGYPDELAKEMLEESGIYLWKTEANVDEKEEHLYMKLKIY
jgi:dCMP deaminase